MTYMVIGGIEFPAKFEVCPRCQGHGTHDCFDNGMTRADMDEYDHDFAQDYIDGAYSKLCDECGGKRVVLVFDGGRATKKQRLAYSKIEDEENERHAIEAAERRMGC